MGWARLAVVKLFVLLLRVVAATCTSYYVSTIAPSHSRVPADCNIRRKSDTRQALSCCSSEYGVTTQ